MQLGSIVAISVIDCGRRGVGVVTLEAVDAGQFLGEYVGEVISSREACKRVKVRFIMQSDRGFSMHV
jgi:SET domain-containing protein